MTEIRSRMARKKMSLLSKNCNGDVQGEDTSGHENVLNGFAGKVSMNQLKWLTSMESNTSGEEKSVESNNGYDTDDSEEEGISKSEAGSISSEETISDMNPVNGIKPRSFYSSHNQRQQTRPAARKLQRKMADKQIYNSPKDTQHHRRTAAVKRKQNNYSTVVPAKKVRSSERSSTGRTFRKCNGQLNGNFEVRRQTRSSVKKSSRNHKLCNGTENGAVSCLEKESANLQENPLFSSSDSPDQAFTNEHRKSDLESSACSDDSIVSGPGVISSGFIWETPNGMEQSSTESSLDSELQDPVSDEDKTMMDLTESESSQKSTPLFPSPSSSSGVSPSASTEDSESASSSARSSPENQAFITKYFKTLPGQMSKNIKLTQRSGTALCTSPLRAGKKPKTRSPHSRKSSDKGKLEQMYLDLGQKDFGHVTCQTCGMVYTKAQPDDEADHIKHHKRFVSGLKFMGWKNERVVQEFHDGRVIMVTPDDHSLHTKKVEEIRKVVDAELGFASDPPFRKHESKTFLFISNKRVVGCAVAIQIDKGYPVLPNNNKDTTPDRQLAAWCCSSTPQPAQCGISRIWVFSPFRRKKIATRLIECVRTNFIYGCIILKEKLAFSDPTPDGKRLAQSYAGTSQFLVFR